MSEASEPPNEPSESKRGLPNLAVRFITAGIGIPIILWMLFYADPLVFSAFGVLAAGVAASELAAMTLDGERVLSAWMIFMTSTVALTLTFSPTGPVIIGLLIVVFLSGPLFVLARPDPLEKAAMRMGWLVGGPIYLGGALAAVAKLHHLVDLGGAWVALAMVLAWGSDTGGYFAGRAFGRHKLYEKISPKKTVEGAIGGLVTVVVLALIAHFVWIDVLTPPHAIALALVAGATGQAGDLCISVIKRSTGVKDSGWVIPGHGGLLDRIDALMFTATVTFVYATWVLELEARVPALPGF